MPEYKNRMDVIIEQVVTLKNYLTESPDRTEKQVMQDLKLKKTNLYRLLTSLANDPIICVDGKFPVLAKGHRLSLKLVEKYLAEIHRDKVEGPKPAERLLYLYHILHTNLPYGGVTMRELRTSYLELIEKSTGRVPADSTLRRMIYRDLLKLEQIGIAIDRPSTGSNKYCLQYRYLPKLSTESAAAMYASMLLHQDTLLEKAVSCARQELEKAFFRNIPEKAHLLADRIHIIGDKLAHPEEFGDTLGKLVRAVIDSNEIKITYIKLNGQISERGIHPLGMVYKRNVWYVIAWDPRRNDFRTFRVDQILSIVVYDDKPFCYPKNFNIGEHIGNSWGVFCDDPVQVARLRFSPAVTNRIKKLLYHPSQKIIKEDRHGIVIQYEVCGFKELQSWVLQWGPEVEVLEPLELKEQVRERARQVLELYQERGQRATVPGSL